MKFYKIYFAIIAFLSVAVIGCNRTESGDVPFDNMVYIDAASVKNVSTLTYKSTAVDTAITIRAAMALPEQRDINITYKIDASLVSQFNAANHVAYEMLPTSHYALPDMKTIILKGTVISPSIRIEVIGVNQIPDGKIYVLPVTIDQSDGITLLNGAKTLYFIVKKGSIIFTSANMTRNFFKPANITSGNTSFDKVTMECLAKFNSFKTEAIDGTTISSVMGTEGNFLLRIGDKDDKTQMELVSKVGVLPGPKLQTNRWYHIAATYDNVEGKMIIYLDGEPVAQYGFSNTTKINFAATNSWEEVTGFHIGTSWDVKRWMDGDMCECRIWSVARTQDELIENMYQVDPNTSGLYAYWKMNEESGSVIHDFTGNGHDATANADLSWTPADLPPTN
jgi:hypothetical protein